MRNHRLCTTVLLIAFTTVFAGFGYAAENPLKISGYIKTAFTYIPSDAGDASETNLSNARIKATGSVNDKTSYTIMFDAAATDILLDAYITHTLCPALTLKAGQFKTPYSTDNLIANSKYPFINRVYMRKDTSPAFRDRGITVAFAQKLINAEVGVMNGSGANTSETNNNKSVACRVVVKPLSTLNISGNYYTGKNNAADGIRDELVNIGVNGVAGAWEYSAEAARKEHDKLTGNSYFAWIAYDFKTGIESLPTLTPALRAEVSDLNTDTDNDAKSRYTIGLTAHFDKKYADSVMFNYEMRELEKGDADDLIGVQYVVSF